MPPESAAVATFQEEEEEEKNKNCFLLFNWLTGYLWRPVVITGSLGMSNQRFRGRDIPLLKAIYPKFNRCKCVLVYCVSFKCFLCQTLSEIMLVISYL